MTTLRVQATGEHDGEPVPGLPGHLPADEHIVWQGAPDWKALAVQAFHLRKVALYFGLLLAWLALATLHDTGSTTRALAALPMPAALAAAGLGLLAFLAWLSARTTVYTLTNRRVVMRVGIVLTVTFNLPLQRIDGAALRRHAGGSGDVCLHLAGPDRIAYLHLWPHVRPWRVARTEPTLRALPQAEAVARQVAAALQATLDAAGAAAHSLPPMASPISPASAVSPTSAVSSLGTPASASTARQPEATASGGGLRPAAA